MRRRAPGPTLAPTAARPARPARPAAPVPAAIRAVVWLTALSTGFVVTVLVLRQVGALDVNRGVDLYAGSGPGRFGVLLLILPMWAFLAATIAHFWLEAAGRRRRRRGAGRRDSTSARPDSSSAPRVYGDPHDHHVRHRSQGRAS